MNLHYDKDADALEIELVPDARSARTVELDTGTLIDLDDDGQVISIEVIRPARPWPLEEILERFDIDPDAAGVLRAMWQKAGSYPVPTGGHATGSATGELIRS